MNRVDAIEILEVLVEENHGWSLYPDYSGRGMYGRFCYGIVCRDFIKCIEAAASMGLTGARLDNVGNVGLEYIVYWPDVMGDRVEDFVEFEKE